MIVLTKKSKFEMYMYHVYTVEPRYKEVGYL